MQPNFVFSFKIKLNYYIRTIPSLSDHLQPLEDTISKDFLLSPFGCKVKEIIRRLIALQLKLGGMEITNPTDVTNVEYENSIRLIKIFYQDDYKSR